MLQPYRDITRRLGDPLWRDSVGVPRYDPFHPSLSNNIYAREVALLEIRCCGCQRLYHVAINWMPSLFSNLPWKDASLRSQIVAKTVAYGDPPCWHPDCDAGATMQSDTVRVVEFWSRSSSFDWQRDPNLEVAF